jgi:hypothetical protein
MSKNTNIRDCIILEFPKIYNRAGNITPLENLVNIPFKIKRVYYLYDIPGGVDRGEHSHMKCHQLLIAASGSFDVMLDDGVNKRTVNLNRPYYALHIYPGIWSSELRFSSGSICLVLASHLYEEKDYIRNYEDFIKYKNG